MAERVKILVATMTGNAELCADEMADAMRARGAIVEVVAMDGLDATVFDDDCRFVICTSTYGQGDVPDNGQALYRALTDGRPDLGHVVYGVFGLGDSTYVDTFGFGGKRFDEALSACGARRVGAVLVHDASSGELPEDAAQPWAEDWLDALAEVAAAA